MFKEDPDLTPHNNQIGDVMTDLATNQQQGLSAKEAAARIEKYGENKLREKKKKTTIQRFFDQFKDAMIIILLIAAVVSLVMICVEKNWSELFEPGLILLIVVLNAVMGVYQEGKAERALDALKNMSAP
ncbi:MAG: ATPase, partial [Clostridia bacterium]|nr:ATPase [Clostridia bacterium]